MCVLYLLTNGSKARKDGGRILVEKDGNKLCSVPLHEVKQVVVSQQAEITTPVIFSLLEAEVPILYVGASGEVKGMMGGEQISLHHFLQQQVSFGNAEKQLNLARELVREKIRSQRMVLLQYRKSRGHRELSLLAEKLGAYERQVTRIQTIEKIRGLEGIASRVYFSAVPYILVRDLWEWRGRTRRPAKDPINALLNYGYACLEREVRMAILAAGLDARFGVLHSNNGRKDSLVYDLMELFRQRIVDRFVFKSFNYGDVHLDDFVLGGDGCRIGDAVRREWLVQYESYMQHNVKEYGDLCPRVWLRKRVQDFAAEVFCMEESA